MVVEMKPPLKISSVDISYFLINGIRAPWFELSKNAVRTRCFTTFWQETLNTMATKTRLIQDYLDTNTGIFESSSSTKFKKVKFQHTWSIDDFEDYCDLNGTKIASSIFSDGTMDGLKWRLEMNNIKVFDYIRDDGYLNLDLLLISTNFDKLEANCQISVLNGKLGQSTQVKKKVQFTKSNLKQTFGNFISKKNLLNSKNQYLLDGKLTILCEIAILGNAKNTSNQFANSHDLGLLLFENPDYAVVTFSVSGKELRALKAVLVANSPVFAAMFNHSMKENEISRIEIVDIEYEVLENMLRYLYTKKINNLETMADRLFVVADKYALEDLKRKCEESMIKNLSVENFAQYYDLAKQHNADEFKNRVKNFIIT